VPADGFDVLFPEVVSPDLHVSGFGQVGGEQASYRAATDDADSHLKS
jgi:hypothetical protein